MGFLVSWLDRVAYPQFGKNWDDELFRQRILQFIRSTHVVLDLGAGAGIVSQMNFKGVAAQVCGVDLDPRVLTNPHLDEAKIAGAEGIPYPDMTFDVVFADNVLEHLDRPENVLREVYRVLKPGGHFFAKTPNKWHYMSIIAQLTPQWFHRFAKSLMGTAGDDVFPTAYRINTPPAVAHYAGRAGLRVEDVTLIEGRPEYLRMSFPTYLAGFCYERLVNLPPFERFRILMAVHLRRPSSGN